MIVSYYRFNKLLVVVIELVYDVKIKKNNNNDDF